MIERTSSEHPASGSRDSARATDDTVAAEGDCADQPFRTTAPCIEQWAWLWGKPQWTSWVTPAVQNDWDERGARQYLSQWRLRLEQETTDRFRARTYLSNHWQVDPVFRPHLVVEYLVP